MKILSWNVNGVRSIIRKGFEGFVGRQKADILCLQETKARPEQVELDLKYHAYWNSAEKKGYSGTLILSKKEPISVARGLGQAKHDREGRVLIAEYPKFYLVNVYTPNAKRDLSRLNYRTKEWDVQFLKKMKKLEKKKPVIFCGDLNVAHKEIDLTNPKANVRNHGFTAAERAGFDNIVKAGFLDTFREFNQKGGHYTWWSQLNRARARNVGWRIDYFLISKSLRRSLKKAFILPEVMGSDHCPVGIVLR
ncbi:MAG: exodeoxyribonuclease III [Candidatus Omnitrophota bacterium]|nr:exodeoxyribonuclease III [Candidatus Omnitrophota bacterium]